MSTRSRELTIERLTEELLWPPQRYWEPIHAALDAELGRLLTEMAEGGRRLREVLKTVADAPAAPRIAVEVESGEAVGDDAARGRSAPEPGPGCRLRVVDAAGEVVAEAGTDLRHALHGEAGGAAATLQAAVDDLDRVRRGYRSRCRRRLAEALDHLGDAALERLEEALPRWRRRARERSGELEALRRFTQAPSPAAGGHGAVREVVRLYLPPSVRSSLETVLGHLSDTFLDTGMAALPGPLPAAEVRALARDLRAAREGLRTVASYARHARLEEGDLAAVAAAGRAAEGLGAVILDLERACGPEPPAQEDSEAGGETPRG